MDITGFGFKVRVRVGVGVGVGVRDRVRVRVRVRVTSQGLASKPPTAGPKMSPRLQQPVVNPMAVDSCYGI